MERGRSRWWPPMGAGRQRDFYTRPALRRTRARRWLEKAEQRSASWVLSSRCEENLLPNGFIIPVEGTISFSVALWVAPYPFLSVLADSNAAARPSPYRGGGVVLEEPMIRLSFLVRQTPVISSRRREILSFPSHPF